MFSTLNKNVPVSWPKYRNSIRVLLLLFVVHLQSHYLLYWVHTYLSFSPVKSWQYACPSYPRSKQCKLMQTLTDIVLCFLNWRILHIYFKPNCTNGRVVVAAIRCGHRIQTNCRDISFAHSQRWHCCGEIKRWHLCWCTWGKETTVQCLFTIRNAKGLSG